MEEKIFFHAIKIIEENCTGCTKCVRICPTQALKVRNGIVQLDAGKCIDCGKCVITCQFDAIQASADKLEKINKFKYKLAIISTPYAGQFRDSVGYMTAKKALHSLGFDEVAEEAMITETMSKMIREYIRKTDIRPIISSNCPAVVRLIQVRFPSLLPNVLRIEAPMSVLSVYYRNKICEERNLKEDEVGIFLIVPCVAQVTAVHQPEGTYKHLEDGAISIQEVYNNIMPKIHEIVNSEGECDTYPKGLSWAISGAEADEVNDGKLKTMAVSGIENVNQLLIKIENHQLEQFDYIVMNSCTNGCVGGVLNVEDPFVSTSRIKSILRESEHKDFHDNYFWEMFHSGRFDVMPLKPRSIMKLDEDIKIALIKMKKLKEIMADLPGLDCSACGNPTCCSLAEDIVEGESTLDDCVVLLKRREENK
jgi:Fe-S-cluster-containing hydrogenase component 2